MARDKASTNRNIELEYSYDRLMDKKIIQVYSLLVPDKCWTKDSKQTSKIEGEISEYADSSNIRKSLLR